jgi:hypothetical protein
LLLLFELLPVFRRSLNFRTESLFTSLPAVNTAPTRLPCAYEPWARSPKPRAAPFPLVEAFQQHLWASCLLWWTLSGERSNPFFKHSLRGCRDPYAASIEAFSLQPGDNAVADVQGSCRTVFGFDRYWIKFGKLVELAWRCACQL